MMFDTDVLIWFLRGNEKAGHLIDGAPERTLSAIALMELLQGARSVQESREIRRFLQRHGFRVLPVTESISHLAIALIEEHALRDGLQLADSLISATARENGETLATGNMKHFRRIKNLDLKPFRP